MTKLNRKELKEKAMSRDCSCVAGKDRDSNFNEVVDEICEYYENIIEQIETIIKEKRNDI